MANSNIEQQAYNQHTWSTGEPITQEKMNQIEQGVANAIAYSNSITNHIGEFSDNRADTSTATVHARINAIKKLATDASGAAADAVTASNDGQNAWYAISEGLNVSSRITGREAMDALKKAANEVQETHDLTEDITATTLKEILLRLKQLIDSDHSDLDTTMQNLGNVMNELNSVKDVNHSPIGEQLLRKAIWSFGIGTAINASGDLNNYYEPGNYYIAHAAAPRITNMPSSDTGGGILKVFYWQARSIVQMYIDCYATNDNLNTVSIYLRNGIWPNDDSTLPNDIQWTSFYKFRTNLATQTESGYLSANDKKLLDSVNDVVTNNVFQVTGNVNELNFLKEMQKVAAMLDDLQSADSTINTNLTQVNSNIAAIATELQIWDSVNQQVTGQNNSRIDQIETAYQSADTALDGRLETIEEQVNGALTDYDTLNERFEAIEGTTATSSEVNAIDTRLQTVEGKVSTAESNITDLDARLDKIDGGSALSGDKTLATLVSENAEAIALKANTSDVNAALDTKADNATVNLISTTIIKDKTEVTYTNGIPDNSQSWTIVDKDDYLLQASDDKYYYWKHINNAWHLMGGAGGEGGTGSSSGIVLAQLPDIADADENMDYFIGNSTIGYTHYRFYNNEFIKILPKGLLTNASINANGKPIITTVEDTETNLFNDFLALKTVDCETIYDTDGTTPKMYTLTFYDTNNTKHQWELAAGGGGGSAYSIRFVENTDLELYVPNATSNTAIQAQLIVRQGNDNIAGTATVAVRYKLSSATNYTEARTVNINTNTISSFEIGDLLTNDAITNIQLEAIFTPEDIPFSRTLNFTVHKVDMAITLNNYNPSTVKTNNFNIQYYCIGTNLSKVVHLSIDGVETTQDIGVTGNTDVQTSTINVTNLARGMHSLQLYYTTGAFSSNIINTYFLYNNDASSLVPIIGVATTSPTIQDGDTLEINYTVYTAGSETTDEVELFAYTLENNVEKEYKHTLYSNVVNSTTHSVIIDSYPSSGTLYIRMIAKNNITSEQVLTDTKTTQVVITEYQSPYDSQMTRAGAANLLYEYIAAGKTNYDSNRAIYTYDYESVTGEPVTFTATNSNFNWATNGYTNGEALLISGGATHNINVPLFVTSSNGISLDSSSEIDSILTNGRTFEIDYEVNSASKLDAVIGSFGDGLKITPQACYLVPSGTNVTINSSGLIEKEDEICAAYLTTDKRLHMTFVIEPKSNTPTSHGEYHQCVNIYINGEFVNSCPYTQSDNFSTNATFTLGSDTCIIKLYRVSMYNRGLTDSEVLQNYMMAPATKFARIERFARNDVLDGNKKISYEKAINKFNCLLITGEISPYKKETKTPCGLTLTKPTANQQSYTTEFNLLDNKGKTYVGEDGDSYLQYYSSNNVQGTSSQTYPVHNLKVYLAKQEINAETGEASSKKVKYSLKGAEGIGESTLCWKADYMSTDHANTYNANFANDLFNELLPSQVQNSKVQNTVYGIRCLLFQRKDENSAPVFIADGCLNNDKGNNSSFGLNVEGDSNNDTLRQKWEFTNNSSLLDFFRADGLLANNNGKLYATTAFESTYPDEGDLEDAGLVPNYNHLQIILTWVYQRANYWDASDAVTGTTYEYDGVTYDNLKAYKKAIFAKEFSQHFNLNHTLTYHLFSEFIALCDNRAKNMFLRCDDVKSEVIKMKNSDENIFSGNENPNADFFKNTALVDSGVVDATTGENIYVYTLTNADQIDWENSTFATWYPVLYDLDSCYGVENVGKINIAYDADWNYTYNGKNQFSGVDSRFWLMVEDTFQTELQALAIEKYPLANGLNYNSLYTQQIKAMLDSTCPALTNQDMLAKFNAFWADGFIDYSLEGNPHVYRDYKYLQRGTRAYQKDSFIKRRANYLSGKYTTSNYMNNQIRFRSSQVIRAEDSGITLTVNQTLYPAITYGDNKPAIRSATKVLSGQSITIKATDQVGNTDTIHIGGASALTDIGDISKFWPYDLNVGGGVNLKTLTIGSDSIINNVTNTIDSLSSCALLEEINVRNCTALTSLSLVGNSLIKRVYTSGSGITNINLPAGGNLTDIEYSENATTINIINHSRLNNFVYQNSETNHYANVTRLHIENTPNVPVVDIINNALPHLTQGIRLVGIDVDLGNDDTFLQLITSELADNKYINSAGNLVLNSGNPPHITGTVRINEIRQSLLNTLHELYPELNIIYNTLTIEYRLTYVNVDAEGNETELITLYRTGQEVIPDPVLDKDLVTDKYYIESSPEDEIEYNGTNYVPVRAADAQYIYRFGLYTGNTYRRYSGWAIKEEGYTTPTSSTRASGDYTLVAVYPEISRIIQKYTVTWLDYNGDVLNKVENVEYGTDGSQLIAPNKDDPDNPLITTKSGGGKYLVFTGWDKPLTIITGDLVIQSQWAESRGDFLNTVTDLNDLNVADWYALTKVSAQQRQNFLDQHLGVSTFNIKLGHDFNYDDYITTYNLLNDNELYLNGTDISEIKIFDGNNNNPTIYPLSTLNKDFTIALDFKFLMDQAYYESTMASSYVLASCYKTGSSVNGFYVALERTTQGGFAVVIKWGEGNSSTEKITIDNVTIDSTNQSYTTYRNMLVLRHRAAEPQRLYVYYSAPQGNNPAVYNNLGVGTAILSTSAVNTVTNPLILGGIYSGSSIEQSTQRTFGKGIFYYAKYWDADIGNNNCSELVSWPHEVIAYKVGGYDNGATGIDSKLLFGTGSQSTINFVPAQALGDRYYNYRSSSKTDSFSGEGTTLTNGWHNSFVREFCNSRVYSAFPTEYQSLMLKMPITSVTQISTNTADTMNQPYAGSTTTDDNYIYQPSYFEIETLSAGEINYRVEANHSWPWLSVANSTVYTLSGNNLIVEPNANRTLNYLRLQFFNKPVRSDARIFHMNAITDPTASTYRINNVVIPVESGDIWYDDESAYIYIDSNEIAQGAQFTKASANNGGWVLATQWATRTYNYNSSNRRLAQFFIKVRENGSIYTDGLNTTAGDTGLRSIIPEFSI